MLKKLITTSFISLLAATSAVAAEDLALDAKGINPSLAEVRSFYDPDTQANVRILHYRGGFEHVTSYVVVQHVSVDAEQSQVTLSVPIEEVNYKYSVSIADIDNTDSGFAVTLNGTHSYSHEETTMTFVFGDDLSYDFADEI
uniref:hypothetical protein n=1 Tax=Thaumasiovibrio occultus TaxID=1891184 RepID=UPI000B356EC1|nr:hypothetical protein [Thaumasiovibrio occultus]